MDYSSLEWQDAKPVDFEGLEWQDAKPMTQSVMDAQGQEVYNVPLNYDGVDTDFAIKTQHKNVNKANFFGKVEAINGGRIGNFKNDGLNREDLKESMRTFFEGVNSIGQTMEDKINAFNRGTVATAGEMTSAFVSKAYHYADIKKRIEKLDRDDYSDYGDNLSDERKAEIKKTLEDKAKWIEGLRGRIKEKFGKAEQILRPDEKVDSMDEFFMGLGSATTSMLPLLGTNGILKAPELASGFTAYLFGKMKEVEYFDKALKAGKSAEDADLLSTGAGLIESGLEYFGDRLLLGVGHIKPIKDISKKVIEASAIKLLGTGAGKEAVKKIASKHTESLFSATLKGAGTEFAEESSQSFFGDLYENITDVSNKSLDDMLNDALFSGVVAMFSGGPVAFVGTNIYNHKMKAVNDKIKDVLIKQQPDLTETELQATADTLQEVLFQEEVSYAKELNKVAEKELQPDALPEGLTVESLTQQTRKMLKEVYGMTDEEIDNVVNASLTFIDARNQFNDAYRTFYDLFERAGVNVEKSDAGARLLSARALAIARAEQISVKDVIDRFGLSVQAMRFADFEKKFNKAKSEGKIPQDFNIFQAVVDPKYLKGQKRNPKKVSLLAFIKSHGGIKDTGGDVKSMGGIRQYPALINNKTGISLDDMAQTLWDNGYFVGEERPEINELLDAIDRELRGEKIYSENDRNMEADAYEQVEAMKEALDQLGIDYRGMTAEELEKAYNKAVDDYNARVREFVKDDKINLEEELGDFIPFQTQIVDETNNIEPISQETIRQFSNEARKFFNDIQQGKKEKKTLGFGKVKNWLANTSRRFNLNIDGFKHIVDLGGFVHIDIRHGKETKLGQSNITEDDVAKIPEIVSQPNYLVYGIKSGRGLKTIGYIKQFPDEATYYVEEVWRGEKELAAKTMYKKEGGEAADEIISSLIHTSGTAPSTATIVPVVPINISPNTENVKPQMQFQGGEEDRNLYATHNMSLAGVREALKMGGLAMPSLAMRKVGQGDINQFGDIVFVANEKMATPSKSNEVYDRDAWTPNLGYVIRYALGQKGRDYIKEVLDRAGQSQQYSMYRYNIEENLDTPKSNDMAIELYHLDKMSKSNEPVNFDRNSDEYLDWYDEHFTANSEPYLWTENDANTDMISRKLTLNNMMKVLRKQERSGGGFIGDYIFDVYKLLNFRSQKFKNLKEIKKNRDKLVSREEQKEALDKLNEEFLALAEDLKKDGEDYSFGDATYGLGLALIQDNDEQIVHWLDYKNLKSDENAVKKVKDFIEKMKNIPTDYFEVKPRRAVEFSEFSGVIIPEGKRYDEVADALAKQHYLNVERVEKGNKAQYEQALRNIQANSETAFFQNEAQTKQPPRGAFYDRVIYLFENADASTIVHEMAHFFLDDMKRFSDNETTKEQLDAIYKYLGSKDGNLTYEQNELFADSFEVYMLDGRSPNSLLGKVFARFKRWLRALYSEVKRLSGIKLTDDIRKTFDEMLGGKGLDYTMQVSRLRLSEQIGDNIPQNVVNKAIELLDKGKMSKADMDDLLDRIKEGKLSRKDVAKEIKKFEESNVTHNEALNPFDKMKYRQALLQGNTTKKDYRDKINKLLDWSKPRSVNGKLVGRFPNLEMNKMFDHIREYLSMDKERAREEMAKNSTAIDILTKEGGEGDIDRLRFDNMLLKIASGNASMEILDKVYNAIADSYNMGRLAETITGQAKKKRKKRLIKEAYDTITDNGRIDVTHEKSEIGQKIRTLGRSMLSWNGLTDILSQFNRGTKAGESKLSQNLDVFESEQKEAFGIAEDGEHVSRLIGKALEGTDNPEISVSRYATTKLKEETKIEWGNRSKTFTKDKLLDIYMKSLDPETRQIMIEDEILGYDEEFLQKVNDSLTSDDIAVCDALFKFYEENYDKINAFYENHYGISLGRRDYYSPRSMERAGVNVDTGDPVSYAGFSGVKKRTAKKGTIKIKGAFATLNEYIVNSNHWIAWSDKLVDINAVMGDKTIKNAIENLFGKGMNSRIAYEISRMASNDKMSSLLKNGMGLWDKIRSNFAVSVLSLKPALMIKQITSFPAYWEHTTGKDFVAGVVDFFKHPKEAMEILGNTTLMKTRGVNVIKDFADISKLEVFKKLTDKVSLREAMMLNIKLGDRGAIYIGGWALYKSELKKNLAKGMSEEEAKKKALDRFERVTDETQQSGRLSQQSYWQSNQLLRAMTMFQSSQNQYLRKEINAVRNMIRGREDISQGLKTLVIFHFLLPMFFQFVSDGFRWDKKAQLRAGLLGSLNGWFILSSVLDKIYSWGEQKITGEKGRRNSSLRVRDVIPFWGSGEDIVSGIEKILDEGIDWDEWIDVVKLIGKPVGEATGVPVKYPLDVIQNFGNYAEKGEYGKEVELWLGWSPYALRDIK